MAGPFSFTDGILTNRDASAMQVLGVSASGQSLLYDANYTEAFFVQAPASAWSSGFSNGFGPLSGTLLYAVSPKDAAAWFALSGPVTVVYNPFRNNLSRLSTVVGGA